MTIAMIGQKGLPAIHGGVERHVHELSTRLVQSGHSVLAYARAWYTDPSVTSFEGIQIVHTHSIKTKHLDTITHTLTATVNAIRRDVDVIHFHGVGPGLLSWIPRIFAPNIRVIGTFHSIDRKHDKWNVWARFMLLLGEWAISTFPHQTIAVSETIKAYDRDVFGKEITYIPNGVPHYTKEIDTHELTQWHLVPGQYFLIVSRLIRHKGIQHAIRTYKQLELSHPSLTQKYPLVIVGDGHHTDDYVNELKHMANGSNIIFTGFQSGKTLAQLFSHAALFIHPSEQEGLPITVLEAISYGTPTIVSDILEHRLIVPDLMYRFSKETLADTILRTMSNYQTTKKYAAYARRRINSEFSWDIITDAIERLYQPNTSAQNMHQTV
jgi:glycosyltransferase involved in cell wall biosynthesis